MANKIHFSLIFKRARGFCMKNIFLCTLFLLITGCGTMVYELETQPITDYPESEKIDLSVELIIPNELESYAHESSAEQLPLGSILAENAINMSKTLFRQVVVTKNENRPPQSGVDAILIPKIVSVAHTRPMAAYSDRKLTVIFQWLLKDIKGKTIWVDTIEGEGINNLGTAFSLESNTHERVELLMEDLFKKSYISISSSKEIKNFKPEI